MKKKYRILKNDEFKAMIGGKRFFSSPALTLYYQPKQQEHARVGLSVSKKLGKAHLRNKIKRQLRMMIQTTYSFNEHFDTIVLVRKNYLEHTYAENLQTLQYLYKKVRKTND